MRSERTSYLRLCDSLEVLAGEDEDYNSVWDEVLGVCYSILQCPAEGCQHVAGLLIHAATSTTLSDNLAGKVSFLEELCSTYTTILLLLSLQAVISTGLN